MQENVAQLLRDMKIKTVPFGGYDKQVTLSRISEIVGIYEEALKDQANGIRIQAENATQSYDAARITQLSEALSAEKAHNEQLLLKTKHLEEGFDLQKQEIAFLYRLLQEKAEGEESVLSSEMLQSLEQLYDQQVQQFGSQAVEQLNSQSLPQLDLQLFKQEAQTIGSQPLEQSVPQFSYQSLEQQTQPLRFQLPEQRYEQPISLQQHQNQICEQPELPHEPLVSPELSLSENIPADITAVTPVSKQESANMSTQRVTPAPTSEVMSAVIPTVTSEGTPAVIPAVIPVVTPTTIPMVTPASTSAVIPAVIPEGMHKNQASMLKAKQRLAEASRSQEDILNELNSFRQRIEAMKHQTA